MNQNPSRWVRPWWREARAIPSQDGVRASRRFRSGSRPTTTLGAPRVGFDLIELSAPTVHREGTPVSTSGPPSSLAEFVRQADCPMPRRSTYERCATYTHTTDPVMPTIEVLHGPRRAPRPQFRLRIRASMEQLIPLDLVERLAAELFTVTQQPLRVSVVELCMDFPGGWEAARQLHRQLLVPRVRRIHSYIEPGDTEVWWVRGSRRSATSVRIYPKLEGGLSVARMEWILRRSALRKLGVEDLSGLRTVHWAEVFGRTVRFVQGPGAQDSAPRRGGKKPTDIERRDFVDMFFPDLVRLLGPERALKRFAAKDRPRLRRRLCAGPTQLHVMGILANLTQELQSMRLVNCSS